MAFLWCMDHRFTWFLTGICWKLLLNHGFYLYHKSHCVFSQWCCSDKEQMYAFSLIHMIFTQDHSCVQAQIPSMPTDYCNIEIIDPSEHIAVMKKHGSEASSCIHMLFKLEPPTNQHQVIGYICTHKLQHRNNFHRLLLFWGARFCTLKQAVQSQAAWKDKE